MENLKIVDEELFQMINEEYKREEETIELIASENFVSKAVLEVNGSVLTNKYAEGYPGKRYYGGCQIVDKIENLARDRVCQIFGAEHANVQPHSGSQANMGVYMSVLNPGDTVLGMNLSHGGHLTHGNPVNFSGRLYKFEAYGVSEKDEKIDYEELRKKALEVKPKLIVAGASAYSRTIEFDKFREIADEVQAYLMVDMAHIAGIIAAGFHPNPVPYADFVTSTTHKTLRGPRGGLILCKEKYAKSIDKAIFPGIQGGPLMHVIAAKAVVFAEVMTQEFKDYIEQVLKNAKSLCDELKKYGFRIVSDGTDTHLMLVDLTNKNITGKDCDKLLQDNNITVNKNTIPKEKLSPFVTSGIRIGTSAVTTRGFKEEEIEKVAYLINYVVEHREEDLSKIKEEVINLCKRFPIYK